jgi:hypothetical protein
MHLTSIGILLIPLNAAVFLLWPSKLEQFLIFMVVFQAASVLNLGGGFAFGLSPYFFTASLLALRIGLRWSRGGVRFQRGEFAQKHLQIAAVFIGWCVVSAFLLPVLFDGIPVDSPRAGAESVFYYALPLRWSFSNAGQAGYMLLNFFALLALVTSCIDGSVQRLTEAFSYSGLIVLVVGFYQLLSFHVGVPFPSSFFNSNLAWAQNYNQMIGSGWHRVSATFVEPSVAGGFLSGWLLFEFILANWGTSQRARHWVFAVLGCVLSLATTSSAAYLTIGLMLVFMMVRLTFEAVARNRILIRLGRTVLAMVIASAVFLFLGHDPHLLDAVLWHKSTSSSAVVRFATVWRAIGVVQDTDGLGAGLGSNRAFGTLAYIASNLGVFGLLAFFYLVVHLFVGVVRGLRLTSTGATERVVLVASAMALVAHLLGSSVAGAEISDPILWVLWGLVLASVRVVSLVNMAETAPLYEPLGSMF